MQNYWQSQQYPYGSRAPRQGSQQWSTSTIPTPASSYGSRYASPVSMNNNCQQQAFFPSQASQSSTQSSPMRQNSWGSTEHKSRQGSRNLDLKQFPQEAISKSQSDSSNQIQLSEQSAEQVEPWLEELLDLDFSEPKPGARPVGKRHPRHIQSATITHRVPSLASPKSSRTTIAIRLQRGGRDWSSTDCG